jgi:hypothetical protein
MPERLFRVNNFYHPANLSVFEPDLDAPGMKWGAGQQIFDDAPGAVATALVFLKNYVYFQARVNIFSVLSVHCEYLNKTYLCRLTEPVLLFTPTKISPNQLPMTNYQ